MLSAYDDDEYVFAILEASRRRLLAENARGSEVIDAVRGAAGAVRFTSGDRKKTITTH